ncbi:MAG TPA: inositol monophosphatase [Candidatus Acidoferrales bacterium]|nr:inositol monophosphatase [Candidatus Acidoferrales bacterium]
MPDRAALRELALASMRAASAVVTRGDSVERAPERKGFGDYVTAVDREAERAAIAVLRRGAPDIPVLAEESGGQAADRVWVIDPVDGTTNLVRGFPMVGVSVALVEEGRPVVGAVGAPHFGGEWSASEGDGAWDARGHRLVVSSHLGAGVAATGFPFRRKQNLGRYLPAFEAALQRFEDLRRAGAASLDLAYVAAGTWDGFFELGLAIWDIAAGSLLVREAGGVVTDWSGDPVAVFSSGDIVAGSPAWHEAMLEITEGSTQPPGRRET